MGFSLFGKTQKRPKEVCIPEARKKIIQEEAEQKLQEERKKKRAERVIETIEEQELPVFEDSQPRFLIEGLFAVAETLMLNGTVVSGKITKSSKLKSNESEYPVKDIQFQGKTVGTLVTGQHGAIFFEKARGLYFKKGDIALFS